ncbi:serine/arginine-rich splicing factor 10-like isoform X2 [Acanthaster planci]|uniref:Serine/arginine-rich splicing factor 10 n=1 Tax=Acanthaster planci TaxID=133434 RepID=A0A8B7ZP77_ACAPL|nr:serine/arginine-rich splicing factor 10-like isoform X2 [Acanthaster planci]
MSRRGSRPPNTSLYVRNIPDHARPDDIRQIFSKYGPIMDVYIPVDHYTREPRGFCYVQFEYVRDAEEAMYGLDRTRFFGRELDIQFAEGDRKSPGQMRSRDLYRRRRRSYSRSPDYDRRSRSRSPYRRYSPYKRSKSRSPYRSRRSRSRTRSRSRSPEKYKRRRRRRSYSRSRSRSVSRSRSR